MSIIMQYNSQTELPAFNLHTQLNPHLNSSDVYFHTPFIDTSFTANNHSFEVGNLFPFNDFTDHSLFNPDTHISAFPIRPSSAAFSVNSSYLSNPTLPSIRKRNPMQRRPNQSIRGGTRSRGTLPRRPGQILSRSSSHYQTAHDTISANFPSSSPEDPPFARPQKRRRTDQSEQTFRHFVPEGSPKRSPPTPFSDADPHLTHPQHAYGVPTWPPSGTSSSLPPVGSPVNPQGSALHHQHHHHQMAPHYAVTSQHPTYYAAGPAHPAAHPLPPTRVHGSQLTSADLQSMVIDYASPNSRLFQQTPSGKASTSSDSYYPSPVVSTPTVFGSHSPRKKSEALLEPSSAPKGEETFSHPPTEFPPKPYPGGPNARSPWWPVKPLGKIFGSRLEQMPAIENRLARLEETMDKYLDQRAEQAIRNSQLPGIVFDPPSIQIKPHAPSRLFGGRIWPTALARRVKRNREPRA